MSENDHEIRLLRRQLKQLGQHCGRQGQMIYQLRCQLAELRGLMEARDRGEVRGLMRENDSLWNENTKLRARVETMTTYEKIRGYDKISSSEQT